MYFISAAVILLASLAWIVQVSLPYNKTGSASVLYSFILISLIVVKVKVKWSRYRPGLAQRVDRVIALLFHDRGTRREWVVSSTPRPYFTSGKDPVPILQEAGWAPGPVWTGGNSRPHRDSIPDRPARSQSLYRLSYRAHFLIVIYNKTIEQVNLFNYLVNVSYEGISTKTLYSNY